MVQSWRPVLHLNFRKTLIICFSSSRKKQHLSLKSTNMNFSCCHSSLTSVHFCLGEDWAQGTAKPLLATINLWFYFLNECAQICAAESALLFHVMKTPITRGLNENKGGWGALFFFYFMFMVSISSAWSRFRSHELSAPAAITRALSCSMLFIYCQAKCWNGSSMSN